jgi:chromosome segregation ATPase
MTRLALRATAVLAAGFFTACGHPEKVVVEKYFQAVNAKDKQTLSSFALVDFDQKVDTWVIKGGSDEEKAKAPLPDLVKALKDVEAQIAENRKDYSRYNLDHMKEVDEYKDIRKSGGKIPAKLSTTASDWEKFEQKEKDLRRQRTAAMNAVDREKKNMMTSVGDVDNLEGLEGEIITKTIDLDLTIDGQPQAHKMTLKKYDVKPSQGVGKVISRWVVTDLAKQ